MTTWGPPGSLVGLESARVIVEYPLAADRTGLFALVDVDAEVVGPLRSATPSDAMLAVGFAADLVTTLTTGAVVDELAGSGLRVFEEHTVAGTLVRDPARRAPFNLYAVTGAVRAAVGQREIGVPWSPGAVRSEGTQPPGQPSGGPQAQDEATVPVAGDIAVTWTWDPGAGRWLRTAAGQLEQSATGERVAAEVVLVLEVPLAEDRPLAVADLIGSGPARILRDGTALATRWERAAAGDLPTVHGADGARSGVTWVHVCAAPCV